MRNFQHGFYNGSRNAERIEMSEQIQDKNAKYNRPLLSQCQSQPAMQTRSQLQNYYKHRNAGSNGYMPDFRQMRTPDAHYKFQYPSGKKHHYSNTINLRNVKDEDLFSSDLEDNE